MKKRQTGKNNYILYKHTFPNGKVYIGITGKSVEIRWRSDGSGYRQQRRMWNAIKKYGWSNIKHEVLFTQLTAKEAYEKEKELIAQYKSNNNKYGYNNSAGGEQSALGFKHSTKTRQKCKNAKMGEKNPMFGKHLSDEQRRKGYILNT